MNEQQRAFQDAVDRYNVEIARVEDASFSMDHATQTHNMAQVAYDEALSKFHADTVRPSEFTFDCPVCHAKPTKNCVTAESRVQWLEYSGPALGFGASHAERVQRGKVAQAVYDREAHAYAQRAYDNTVTVRREDYVAQKRKRLAASARR